MSVAAFETVSNLSFTKPWRTHVADLSGSPPTMLSKQEQTLLHWLTAQHYAGEGAIVDGGSFLGGSSLPLLRGLQANAQAKDARVHSYDLFKVIGDSWRPDLRALYGLQSGQDFSHVFRKNIGALADRVVIHAGDLLRETWDETPVEILFLDCCKTTALHDHAMRLWFPRLIPGRSIVVQQDYGWASYHWGNVAMRVLADCFEVLDDMPHGTRAFRVVRRISAEDVRRASWEGMSNADKERHMEDALRETRGTSLEPHLLFSRALVAREVGDDEGAHRRLYDLVVRFPASPAADLVAVFFPELMVGPEPIEGEDWFSDRRFELVCPMGIEARRHLYETTLALRPQRVLEIGRTRGGSTLILSTALRKLGHGKLVSVDRNNSLGHRLPPGVEARLGPETLFVEGQSPHENRRAMALAGGRFDLVFIGGSHDHAACLRIIRETLPYMADDSALLLDCAANPNLSTAVREIVARETGLIDCGRYRDATRDGDDSATAAGCAGIHVLRWKPSSLDLMSRLRVTLHANWRRTVHSINARVASPWRAALRKLRRRVVQCFSGEHRP